MMYARYALYYTPPPGPLAEALAAWLGWDAATGRAVPHPGLAGLPRPVEDLTERPRKYGAHATLKPPFHLAESRDQAELEQALEAFAAEAAPVTLPGLAVTRIGRFLALTPRGETAGLDAFAASVVQAFDTFRAPPSAAELERRRKARLSARQDDNLLRWGYPHVMEDFRFHITLTGPLQDQETDVVRRALSDHLTLLLPALFTLDALSLMGADPDTDRFHLIRRVTLAGGRS